MPLLSQPVTTLNELSAEIADGMPEEIDNDEPIEDLDLQKDIQTYSRLVGYSIAEDLEMASNCYDLEAIIEGMKQYLQDDTSIELVGEKGSKETFESLQKRMFEYQAQKNLERAESYLTEVSKKTTAHILEEGGVVYEVTQSGKGTRPLSENDTIFVQYSIVDMRGRVFVSSQDANSDEKYSQFTCTPDDFLPSISRAMIGMVEGENRIIYVHPRQAYGKLGRLPPNSLLIVTITLVKIVDV